MRDDWKQIKLEEVCEVNKRNINKDFEYDTITYLDISSVGSGDAQFDNLISIKDSPSRAKRLPTLNDSIIATVRPGNKTYYYLKEYPSNTVISTGFAVLSPIKDKIDPRYLYYIISEDSFISYLVSVEKGANYPAVSAKDISDALVTVPPLKTQRKIASILSAYDDLIENNLKRIKLLEEKAQLTYEEWFVRFKFSGYETAEFDEVSGLPVGWEKKQLGEFTDIKKGKNITKATIREGNVPVIAGGLKPAYYHNTPNTKNPVITVSASGANAGYTAIQLEDVWASDCSYIDIQMTNYLYFVYCSMIFNQPKIYHFQKGAAQPHVYPKDLVKLEVIIPNSDIVQMFEDLATNIFDEIRNYNKQNELLKEARDILLPRLMMGMIDVEELEVGVTMDLAAEQKEIN